MIRFLLASCRPLDPSKLLAPSLLLLPTAAHADWGEDWGVLVWAESPPAIPLADPWLLLGAAALLLLSGVVWLRASGRVLASASVCALLVLFPWNANATLTPGDITDASADVTSGAERSAVQTQGARTATARAPKIRT